MAESAHESIIRLRKDVSVCIIGQQTLVDRMLIALLANGHLLVEGAPGLAKTTAIKELARRIEGDYHRIQFTPDLLPADLTGTDIYRPQTSDFVFQPGPIFHNLILADEVNRAPAKVQSALLEAMGERQVTVGSKTYDLPKLFLVMATQNPIEQEGTYPLPEAQLDRFLLHVSIGYPDAESELQIMRLGREQARQLLGKAPAEIQTISQEQLFQAQQAVIDLHLSEDLERYIVELVTSTRDPGRYGEDLGSWVNYGASPRATIALDRCARAHAWLSGRDYVSPEDIHAMAADVMRHRILLSFEAEADGITTQHLVETLIERIPLP